VDETIHATRLLRREISRKIEAFTSPAIFTGKEEVSKRVISPMPERPLVMASQYSDTVLPTGETTPRPVTTTLRRVKAGSGRITS
jgi:hypothetical protein